MICVGAYPRSAPCACRPRLCEVEPRAVAVGMKGATEKPEFIQCWEILEFHRRSGATSLNNWNILLRSRTMPSSTGHALRTKRQPLKGRQHYSGSLQCVTRNTWCTLKKKNLSRRVKKQKNVTERNRPQHDQEVRFSRHGL